jgi:acyl-CoA thioesterase I
MIRRYFAFLGLLFVAFNTFAFEPLPIQLFKNLQNDKKQTVVVYGTSLTHGGAWAKEMKSWFDEQYPGLVTFINSGGPGQNSDWGLAQLKTKVLDHQPDYVLIEFSYNDAHEKFKLPVERGAKNLAAMVAAIHKARPHAEIILQTMNVPWDPPNSKFPAKSRPHLEAYNDNYRAFAKEHRLPLVDHYVAWKKLLETEPAKYHKQLPDGSHPNAEASLAITWKGIRTLLEQAQQQAKGGK